MDCTKNIRKTSSIMGHKKTISLNGSYEEDLENRFFVSHFMGHKDCGFEWFVFR